MTLRRAFNPFEELLKIQRELERLARLGFPVEENLERVMESKAKMLMPLEVYETPTELVVKVELPGVKKEDVDITIRDNYLVIRAEKKEEKKEEKQHVHVVERVYGTFERVIPLPADVDTDNAKASFKDGVLEIRFPKKSATKEKKITIE